MKKRVIIFFATGTYTGYIPVAPGTFGTLWGIPFAWLASTHPPYVQAALTAALFVVSVYAAGEACKIIGKKDPSSVVIDEAVGFLVSFFLIPFTLFNVILVFLLFRFFDILKPYPIGLIDRRVVGGLGVVLDDAAAGIYANILAQIIIRVF